MTKDNSILDKNYGIYSVLHRLIIGIVRIIIMKFVDIMLGSRTEPTCTHRLESNTKR
jgi:hypothetical protein